MTSDHDITPEAQAEGSEQETAPAPEAEAQEAERAEGDLARQLAERTADLQRLQAEYVNYKRRVDRDREVQRVNATASVLASFLPVLDDIGRARDHGELEGGFKAVADSLVQATSAHGLEPFGKHGDVFDPVLHEALMHRLDADAPEGEPTVDAIMQVGYRIGDKVLRPARVAVVEHDDTPVETAEVESDEGASEPAPE
ncbi:nucleotide exchange factor GrpE [Mumia sp. DW29H23]|uniref:nucleotide exchange factor GrpE n=1 Tax=Mumia sp. DW29H23 TaxID=3421241 RepID=UPI003D68163F